MENKQLIEVLESQGIITQQDTSQLINRNRVSGLLKKLQQEWPYESDLESGGHYLNDNELADIYFIYDTDVYNALTAIDKAERILIK